MLKLIFLISVIGFAFRLFGIIDNHSLWTDESNVALYARAIQDSGLPILGTGYTLGLYQAGYYYLLALFGSFGSINEFTLRLPSVIFGTLSVFLAGLLLWKLTKSKFAAIFTSIVFCFSQVQLAYSTQARPYIIIQALSFLIFYLFLLSEKASNKNKLLFMGINFSLGITSLLLHPTGYLVLLAVMSYYFLNYRNFIKHNLTNKFLILTGLVLLLVGYLLNIHFWFSVIISKLSTGFEINNLTYLRELLWNQYGLIFIPSVIGFILLLKNSWKLGISLIAWFGVLLLLWLFVYYSHNVRYLVPLLGWMLILFSYFWFKASTLLPKNSWVIFLVVIIILMLGGNKFVRKPSYYYSPNSDFSSDVQMANYKEVYNQLNIRYGEKLSEYALFDDWNDRTMWYLNRKPDAIFVKDGTYGNTYPVSDPMSGSVFYTTLDQFKQQLAVYPRGIVFVEDWQSIMPDDIKEYIRQNLKREFIIRGLEHSNGDDWPIEVYTWGEGDV